MDGERMRRFWDRRANEDAFYFVLNDMDYRDPDVERFWGTGARNLAFMMDSVDAELQGGETVVEIGCGLGRLTRVIASSSARVHALDISPEMLRRARQLNPGLDNVTWVQGDGVSLAGIPDACADACLSMIVFQHIPDPQVTLGYVREMGRVLKPGGWAVFQISNDPGLHRPRRGARRVWWVALALVGRRARGQGDPAWLGSAVDLHELRTVAASAGMEVERVVGEGRQFCFVRMRRRGGSAPAAQASATSSA